MSLLALVLFASDADARPGSVIERILEATGPGSAPVVATPLKLGSQWRQALATAPTGRLEVHADASTRSLHFAIAARAANPVRFEIQLRGSSGWQSLFSERVEPAATRWSDQWIALPDRPRGAVELRLVTTEEVGGEPSSPMPKAGAWWGSLLALGVATPPAASRPNVVLISLDTLGAQYLSSFDNAPGVSPHIDSFLESGFSFRRAIAQYGNTLVSHASIFSGLYPRHHGAYRGSGFRAPTLVDRLADAGYLTWAITEGGYVAGGFGFQRGFDVYDDGVPLYEKNAGDAPRTFASVRAWLDRYASRAHFFLFVHTYEVHAPHYPRDAAAQAIARRLSPLHHTRSSVPARQIRRHNRGEMKLGAKQVDHLRALYSGEIEFLDRSVDGLLEELARMDLERDTIVVLTADHGEQFGEKLGHGESLHNSVLNVPLGFHWPGHVARGATQDPVQLVDVMPTILDLIGLPVHEGIDGRSLRPALEAGRLETRSAFSEMITAPGECARLGLPRGCRLDRYSVQTRRFKLISSQRPESRVLYDLDADPRETTDVSDRHPEALAELSDLLDGYLGSPATARTGPAPVDDEIRKRLEALGYLD